MALQMFTLLLLFVTFVICEDRFLLTTDELENHISPEDLNEFVKLYDQNVTDDNMSEEDFINRYGEPMDEQVDCFGLGGPIMRRLLKIFNMKPDTSEVVNVHFFFSSRKQPHRAQVFPGNQYGLEWVDFDPKRRTVVIIHGFMSHSNADWVQDMTKALLLWGDVNVIAVDWSGGGNTWKYWRAVANTRRVGADVTEFFQQLINDTGASLKSFHLVGHSLGAHICSYVSHHLGGVSRITGLDPAQPCFRTPDLTEKLDDTDADFVDIIHTNGRLLKKIGFGLPDLTGHADFYPNGGMRQPGCSNNTNSVWSKVLPIARLQQAICSHGRAYVLFTESLVQSNCSFRAHRWNLTYDGVNASIVAACDRVASCSEMGIRAVGGGGRPKAMGPYFVLTTESQPYCPSEWDRRHPRADLLLDLQYGFRIDRSVKATETEPKIDAAYADPLMLDQPTTTTEKCVSKFWQWLGFGKKNNKQETAA